MLDLAGRRGTTGPACYADPAVSVPEPMKFAPPPAGRQHQSACSITTWTVPSISARRSGFWTAAVSICPRGTIMLSAR